MAEALSDLKPKMKALNKEYEKLKWNLMQLEEFQKLKQIPKEQREPIKHKYGSLSLVANPAKYDISAIYDYLGEGILIEYGVPNSKLLEPFILNGMISKKDLKQFRTFKDIRLDFSVMTLEDEQKILEMLDQKNIMAAWNRKRV